MFCIRFIFSLFLLALFVPQQILATGFVPNTPIWYAPAAFAPGDVIRVYTVVVNNDYARLSGTVAFYANSVEVNRVSFADLRREEAEELKVYWQPEPGDYMLRAAFLSAVVVDDAGVTRILDPNDLNTASASFYGGIGQVVATGAQTQVTIRRQGDGLEIKPATNADSVMDTLVAGKDRLDLAMSFVTSGAATLADVYNKTKTAIDIGQEYYAKGEDLWDRAVPHLDPLGAAWVRATDNNNPKRLAGIAVGAAILFVAVKIIRRQRTFDDY